MHKLFMATLVAFTAIGTHAYANTDGEAVRGENAGPKGMRAEMRELLRGDGVDAEGFAAFMQERAGERFDALDSNGDGTISREDYLAAAGEHAQARFARMDRNDDGNLTREDRRGGREWHGRGGPRGERAERDPAERAERIGERAREQFARLDTDGDGSLSVEEFEAGMQARAQRGSERREARGERHAQNRPQGRGEGRGMHGEMHRMIRAGGMDADAFAGVMQERAGERFDALDADGDGTVTREEFLAGAGERAERMFARMDRNEDGRLTSGDKPRWGARHGGREKPADE